MTDNKRVTNKQIIEELESFRKALSKTAVDFKLQDDVKNFLKWSIKIVVAPPPNELTTIIFLFRSSESGKFLHVFIFMYYDLGRGHIPHLWVCEAGAQR